MRGAREVVDAVYAAFADGDEQRMRSYLAEDLRWRQAGHAVPAAGADLAGSEELLERVVRPLAQEWDGFVEEVDDVIVAGERVTATGTYRGTHRVTGRQLTAEFCHLWTVRDGRVQVFRQYTDTAAFAAAAA